MQTGITVGLQQTEIPILQGHRGFAHYLYTGQQVMILTSVVPEDQASQHTCDSFSGQQAGTNVQSCGRLTCVGPLVLSQTVWTCCVALS